MQEFAAFRAFAFGAALGAAVGPIALLIVHVGVRNGLRRAAACAIGVAGADFTYALVALAVGKQLSHWLNAHEALFRTASSATLTALGVWLAWSTARAPVAVVRPRGSATHIGFITTYLLTLANPLTILLFASFSGQLQLTGDRTSIAQFALFIFLGSLPVQLLYASLGAAFHRTLSDRAVRIANLASAGAIAAFGVYGLRTGLSLG